MAGALRSARPAVERLNTAPILEGLRFPAQAAIPLMLLLLGAQLVNAEVGQYWRPALAAAALSLIMAPLVAFGLASLFGLATQTRQAVVLEASMPAAVRLISRINPFSSSVT